MDGLRKLAVVIVALVLILVLLGSFVGAQPWGSSGPGWGMGPGMMGWMMGPRGAAPPQPAPPPASPRGVETGGTGLSWELVILMGAGIVLLVWLLIPRARTVGEPVEQRETPLEIAKRRYVTGEISLPEYEEMLAALVESGEPLDRIKGQGPGSKTA